MPRQYKKNTPPENVEGRTRWKNFTITLVEGKPTHVNDGGVPWWNRVRDHEDFEGHVLLQMFGHEYHLVFIIEGTVVDVIPLMELPERHYTARGDLVRGRSILEIARLKEIFAKQLGYTPVLSEEEFKILAENDPPRLQRRVIRRF